MADRYGHATASRAEAPVVPVGTVLALNADDWSYGRGLRPGRETVLVVSRVRTELSGCYGGEWAWVDGHSPDCGGHHEPCRQALIRAAALRVHQPHVDAPVAGRAL